MKIANKEYKKRSFAEQYDQDPTLAAEKQKRTGKSMEPYDHYWGRLEHFSDLTDPRNLLASNQTLDEAKALVLKAKQGEQVDPLAYRRAKKCT